MDDWWVATTDDPKGRELHLEILHAFLKQCEAKSYFLKPTKCQFMQSSMTLLGWLVTKEGLRIDPAKVTGISEWPTTLRTVKQVRQMLGVLRYQCPFIRNFTALAKPLTNLTKKDVPFDWTKECADTLKALILKVTTAPTLTYPDPQKQFELEVDASLFAIGAILFQCDDKGKKRDVAYYSKALNPAERNYPVWDRELLAITQPLKHWRHLLIGSPHVIVVWMDHSNLLHYREPQKVNRCVMRVISYMEDFHLELRHILGIRNWADALSRRPDHEQGDHDNEGVTALPDNLFARLIEVNTLDCMVEDSQNKSKVTMKEWRETYNLRQGHRELWYKGTAQVVPKDEDLRQGLVQLVHESPTAAHPGIDKMYQGLLKSYWWPGCRNFVREFVKGCAECQANKTITRRNDPPPNPIVPVPGATPFQTMAIDFIVNLPPSEGYNSILSITDHDCTKGVILVPCNETIDAEGVARLFEDQVFPFVGLPRKIISDRDPRFTATFFRELCDLLGIKQNLSTAYHPQTDGQSKKTNQHIETALRIYCNHQQDDWAAWLPIVQYAINARPSSVTKQSPYELWMGFMPRTHQPDCISTVPALEDRKKSLVKARDEAQKAITHAQDLLRKHTRHQPYHVGQRVWLEGKTLQTTHPTVKLRVKRFGPFKVTKLVGKTL